MVKADSVADKFSSWLQMLEEENGYNITLNISAWLCIDTADHRETPLAVQLKDKCHLSMTFQAF